MICGQPNGCGLELRPGEAHVGLESCVEALRGCRVCHEPIAVPLHPGCVPAEVGRRAARHGASALEDWLRKKAAEVVEGIGRRRKRPMRPGGGPEPFDP